MVQRHGVSSALVVRNYPSLSLSRVTWHSVPPSNPSSLSVREPESSPQMRRSCHAWLLLTPP